MADRSEGRRGRSLPRAGMRLTPLRVAGVLAIVCAVIAAMIAAVAWHYSTQLLTPSPVAVAPRNIPITGSTAHTVTLGRTSSAARPGRWGLRYPGGYAQVGHVLRHGPDTITRTLRVLRGTAPRGGMHAAIDVAAFPGDPHTAFGYRTRHLSIPTSLGPAPAWLVPGRTRTWVIVVHGRGGTRREALRAMPVFHHSGLPCLAITYRNDPGAPRSPDGFDHYGFTEWRDVAAAARYALGHGARHLVIDAASLGAEMALRYMELAPTAARVDGLVLDSPVTDWGPVLDRGAAQRGLPGWVVHIVEIAAGLRAGIDWSALDQVAQAPQVRVPVLILRGTGDDQVPASEVDSFAAALGPRADLVRFPGASHAEEWNADPRLYDRSLRAWLRRTGIARRPRPRPGS